MEGRHHTEIGDCRLTHQATGGSDRAITVAQLPTLSDADRCRKPKLQRRHAGSAWQSDCSKHNGPSHPTGRGPIHAQERQTVGKLCTTCQVTTQQGWETFNIYSNYQQSRSRILLLISVFSTTSMWTLSTPINSNVILQF